MKETLEILVQIAQILGPLVGLFGAWLAYKQYLERHTVETYEKLDASYVAFLKFCFENPDLDIFEIPDKSPSPRDEKLKHREFIAFSILIKLFERAYLMFNHPPAINKRLERFQELKRNQWDNGWHLYIKEYCERKNFKEAWPIIGKQFDESFLKYMHDKNGLRDLSEN